MDRRREAMRRLGAPACPGCGEIGAELTRRMIARDSTSVMWVCEPCYERRMDQVRADARRRADELWREQSNRIATERDMMRITAPSSDTYREAVRRHQGEIRAAMQDWQFGGGIFGGGGD